jgi:hypothetical protein
MQSPPPQTYTVHICSCGHAMVWQSDGQSESDWQSAVRCSIVKPGRLQLTTQIQTYHARYTTWPPSLAPTVSRCVCRSVDGSPACVGYVKCAPVSPAHTMHMQLRSCMAVAVRMGWAVSCQFHHLLYPDRVKLTTYCPAHPVCCGIPPWPPPNASRCFF